VSGVCGVCRGAWVVRERGEACNGRALSADSPRDVRGQVGRSDCGQSIDGRVIVGGGTCQDWNGARGPDSVEF
jgi:hypothetical protein